VGLTWTWNGTTWDVEGGGGAAGPDGCYVGDTPPAGAEPGWLWWNSAEGILYVWYDDGDTQQWVEANPGGGGGGGGASTPIVAGTGLTGGTITTSGAVALDTAYTDARYVNLTGDTMTGDLYNQGTLLRGDTVTTRAGGGIGAGIQSGDHPIFPGAVVIGCSAADRPGHSASGSLLRRVGSKIELNLAGDAGSIANFRFNDDWSLGIGQDYGKMNLQMSNYLQFHWNNGFYYNIDNNAWVLINTSPSDKRLKQEATEARPYSDYTSVIADLRPVRYEFIQREDISLPPEPRHGFYAQDVQSVLPEAVQVFGLPSKTPDGEQVVEPAPDMLRFADDASYQLIAVLVGALQETNAALAALTARIESLEALQ
jgi:hypothetical protein